MTEDRPPGGSSQPEPRSDLDWPQFAGAADEMIVILEGRRQARSRRRRVALAVLAAFALGAGLFMLPDRPWTADREGPSSLVVVGAEMKRLPDGSEVELEPGSELEVAYSEQVRRVALRRGRGLFRVAKNPDVPFVVETAEAEVRAVGTAFVVDVTADVTEVVVTSGQVRVDPLAEGGSGLPPALSTLLNAGDFLRVDREVERPTPAVRTLDPDAMDALLRWRIPRVEFSNARLGDLIGTFNQHSSIPIVLVDEALQDLRLSGALQADRIDVLLEHLKAEHSVRVERQVDCVNLRSP